jgi:hypothetical protein
MVLKAVGSPAVDVLPEVGSSRFLGREGRRCGEWTVVREEGIRFAIHREVRKLYGEIEVQFMKTGQLGLGESQQRGITGCLPKDERQLSLKTDGTDASGTGRT